MAFLGSPPPLPLLGFCLVVLHGQNLYLEVHPAEDILKIGWMGSSIFEVELEAGAERISV
jgi:hypothetical protein